MITKQLRAVHKGCHTGSSLVRSNTPRLIKRLKYYIRGDICGCRCVPGGDEELQKNNNFCDDSASNSKVPKGIHHCHDFPKTDPECQYKAIKPGQRDMPLSEDIFVS